MSNPDKQKAFTARLDKFHQVRQTSLDLTSSLTQEDMQIQSMPDASPTKWHLAHTSWAFETFLLKPHLKDYRPFNQQFEYLFNSYYNAIGEQFSRPQRGLLSRPSFTEVLDYREHINRHMQRLINQHPDELLNLIDLMINHEQQHQELMVTDIQHALSINPLLPAYRSTEIPNYSHTEMQWINFEQGLHTIGHRDEPFYFDNEGPPHPYYVSGFRLSNRLVTCGEYLKFIEQGGYHEPSFWLSEAWYELQQQKCESPLYWLKRDNQWFQYTLSGLVPLDLNAPVSQISFFEANAFAASVGKRLPTEQEWEVAARTVESPLIGKITNSEKALFPQGAQGNGLQQMFATLWQWTSSSYNAYPGFTPSHGAIGEYNGKFMVNQYVLRGGSFVTPDGHIRPSYRNFFYPDAKWQFSGIRLAESL